MTNKTEHDGFFGFDPEQSKSKSQWVKDRSKQLIQQKLDALQKYQSVIRAADRCYVSTRAFVESLRKHGYGELVAKYDDRATEREMGNFVPDLQSSETITVQKYNYRLQQRLKLLKETGSLILAAQKLGMSSKNLAFYFRTAGYGDFLEKRDDR